MSNRKKRLQKGIASLEKQIRIHEEKRKTPEEERNIERVEYYDKEISTLKKVKQKKESHL